MTEAGEAALKRFHEWCRAEGVTYDEEVSLSRDTNLSFTYTPRYVYAPSIN